MADQVLSFTPPTYSEFIQAVRKFRPSDLIPLLALMSRRANPNYKGHEDVRALPPWALSAIARESILRGNEHRGARPTEADVRELCNRYHRVFEEPASDSLTGIMGPLFFEQFPWQRSLFEDQTRSISLFTNPKYGPIYPWEDVLGVKLVPAMGALHILQIAVNSTGGRWDSTVLKSADYGPVFDRFSSPSDVEKVASFLTSSIDQFKAAVASGPKPEPGLSKYQFNPLLTKPLVNLGTAGTFAPVGPLIARPLLPAALYYFGADAWGESFTRQYGLIHEQYIGDQLRLIAPQLLSEISYEQRGTSKSVDWIWITDDAVVLVECKIARLPLDGLGGEGRFSSVTDKLEKAYRQIDRTAGLIQSRHPAFKHVPADRRIVGLVITDEPLPMANSGLNEWGKRGTVPAVVCTSRDVEHLVTHSPADALAMILNIFDDHEVRKWDFERAIGQNLSGKRNPISEQAWVTIDSGKLTDRTLRTSTPKDV